MPDPRNDILDREISQSVSRLLGRLVGPSPLHPRLDARRPLAQADEPACAWAGGGGRACAGAGPPGTAGRVAGA